MEHKLGVCMPMQLLISGPMHDYIAASDLAVSIIPSSLLYTNEKHIHFDTKIMCMGITLFLEN